MIFTFELTIVYSMINPNLTFEENRVLVQLKKAFKIFLNNRLIIFCLYGSKAKGDYDSKSDTDIAIVVKGLSRKEKKQGINLIADIELEYTTSLSTIVFSEEEFEFLKKRERRIALDIEKEGMPL